MPLKILIVDDHPMFRRGVRDIVEDYAVDSTIAEADNGASAIQHLELMAPDVAFVDLALPEVDGLEVLDWAARHAPDVKCIVLTMYDERQYLERALELGACGYVLKDDSELEIHKCLDTVLLGETFVSPRFGRPRTQLYPLKDPEREALLASLTPAQRQILKLVGQFKTSADIAEVTGLSVRTVQNHRYAIATRLKLSGANELLRFAAQCAVD